jgi:hypothetical protein
MVSDLLPRAYLAGIWQAWFLSPDVSEIAATALSRIGFRP